jgi:hypothetical protein
VNDIEMIIFKDEQCLFHIPNDFPPHDSVIETDAGEPQSLGPISSSRQ